MKHKAILFDIDGVFIHGQMFSEVYCKEHGLASDAMNEFFATEFSDCLIGKSDLRDLLPKHFEEWKWKGNISSFLYYWFSLPAVIDPYMIKLNKEFREKGLKTYAVTNQEMHRANFIKENLRLGENFDDFFSSASIGYKKPDKEFFNAVLEKINLKPEEVLYIDDDENNVASAKQLGIKSIHFQSFDQLKSEIKDLTN